jgi:hypothetical protein
LYFSKVTLKNPNGGILKKSAKDVFYQSEAVFRQQKNMELYGPHAPKRRNANVHPYITKEYM